MSRNENHTAIQARFTKPELEEIENWRRAQVRIPPLAETMRRLVKLGMLASPPEQTKGRYA